MSNQVDTLVIAVPAAVAAATCFGLTGALQHRAARRTDQQGAVRVGLLWDLLHQPLWLSSLVANAFGVLLQWLALSTGPLILIQPLLVTGLLFAVIITSALHRQRVDRVVLLGAMLCVGGLAGFLLMARPQEGQDWLAFDQVLPFALGLAVILAGCLVVAHKYPGTPRVLALATATGVLYGVTASLTKLAADDLRGGILAMLTDWPFYLVAICGVLGFWLNQNAFRVGVALAPALAVIVILDPLVGIGIGVLWLGERLQVGVGPVFGQVLALGVLIIGVAILSVRAPQVAQAAKDQAVKEQR